jgi:hypothetical protein
MNGEQGAAVRAAPPMIDPKRQLSIGFGTTALDDGALAEDPAIWRHAADLELEDTTVLENQFENFAILCNWR